MLATVLGSDAFRKYHVAKDCFQGPFLSAAFEIIALGLASSADTDGNIPPVNRLKEKIIHLWKNPQN